MCMVKRVIVIASLSMTNKHLNLPPPSPKDDPDFHDDVISHVHWIIRRPCEMAPKPKMCATIRLEDTMIKLNSDGKGPPPQTVRWALTPLAGKAERLIEFEANEACTAVYELTVQALQSNLVTEGWIHEEPGPWECPDVIEMLQYPADVEQLNANWLEKKKGFDEYVASFDYE
ncbi:MAG: hypothetical protein LQ347_004566 [Umbilicaria vellea]|nr:MAG: hypothetical protein LQ347_004566 [Umbilicaria vellea]